MNDEVEQSENGDPYSVRFADHYYSRHDGRAETRHVFLGGNDLPARWANGLDFQIGELGFGTGLNFLETWLCWRDHRKPGQRLTFTSVEGFGLSAEQAHDALRQWPPLDTVRTALIDQWATKDDGVWLDDQTRLHVINGLAEDCIDRFPPVDAWFFDGFAPDRNPDMWSLELMKRVAARSSPGASFSSYTAAGWVRRNLSEAGFEVERTKGFHTKRHMIVGRLK